ncbi:MAG: hypothetical protein ACYDC1_08760 [Limisphaerales bacterium]
MTPSNRRKWMALGIVIASPVVFLLFQLLRPYSFPVPTPNGYEDFIKAASSIEGDLFGASQEDLRTFIAQNSAALALVEAGL